MARATYERGAKVRRWERKLDDPSAALKQIGALMVAESQAAFREQRFAEKAWDARAPVNVFGIIADFHQGRTKPPQRRFERRPALVDTGRLRSSISFQLRSPKVVEVGTNLDYAAAHQFGGKVKSKPLTRKVRRALWRWLRNEESSLRKRLGWLLNRKFEGKEIEAEVPARPFVGITKQTIEDVREVVGVTIMEAR